MTDREWKNELRKFEKLLRRKTTKEAKRIRAEYRNKYGVIFVGKYTVEAHWRRVTQRRGRVAQEHQSPQIH